MGYSTLVQDGVVCGFVTQLSMSVAHSLVVISRVSLITAELLVLIITWRATLKTSRDIRALGQGMLLSATMFRDGVMYFVVLLFINVLHFIFTSLSVSAAYYNCCQPQAGRRLSPPDNLRQRGIPKHQRHRYVIITVSQPSHA
ncbi:hypothetical protein C8Q76DRAFT_719554 [Earliella scabrosa]|nr:hypothetical protein C8Q76DRAFT_719554 [Earliella scabrosa]